MEIYRTSFASKYENYVTKSAHKDQKLIEDFNERLDCLLKFEAKSEKLYLISSQNYSIKFKDLMRVLVTGSDGFIGSHLVKSLRRGYDASIRDVISLILGVRQMRPDVKEI